MENNLFGDEIVRLTSFTDDSIGYEINKTKKTCTCPHFTKNGGKVVCKHLKHILGIKDKKEVKKKSYNGINPSLVKSALQKAIRRNMPEKALMYAKTMIANDFQDFVRRLAIIVIEDGILHPEYRRLADLCGKSAKKTYEKNDDDCNFTMKVVEQLAKIDIRDAEFIEYTDKRRNAYDLDEVFLDEDKFVEEIDLISAIKYRGTMGGMRGDIDMMKISVKLWGKRFKNKEYSIKQIKDVYDKIEVRDNYLNISRIEKVIDIIPEAVDFHCSPLVNIMMRKPEVKEAISTEFNIDDEERITNTLKQIIWRMRSGVSFKKCVFLNDTMNWLDVDSFPLYNVKEKNSYIKIYSQFATEIDNISVWFVKKQFENKYGKRNNNF